MATAAAGPEGAAVFHRPDDSVSCFAGHKAEGADGEPTMAILTTDANATAQPVHGRMPLVLPDEAAAEACIDPEAAESTLWGLLAPPPDDLIGAYPIVWAVNRPQNDGPELTERRSV